MSKKNFLKVIGPGILWAGASIGVSHIVQSTRAGADFGFALIWLVILANLLKYPFFEFAPRYAASTGETLIDGYGRLGKWAVWLYALITIFTMFFLMSAISLVTAGIFANVFNSSLPLNYQAIIIILFLAALVVIGKYSLIDKFVKFIIVLLAIAVIIAVFFAFSAGYHPQSQYLRSFNWQTDIAFLLALVGWMPTAIDVSVWHSVWTIAKKEETGYAPKLKEALTDFKIGYFGTAVLSLFFLSLGALIMYGTGTEFSGNSIEFSKQLIHLFTEAIGPEAYFVIAIAALATMISTSITCLDAYPRVLEPTTKILIPSLNKKENTKKLRLLFLAIVTSGTIIIFLFFLGNMKQMVDIATIIAFLTAPILGWLNLKVMRLENVSKEAKPGKFVVILSYIGIAFLVAFGLYFIYIYLLS